MSKTFTITIKENNRVILKRIFTDKRDLIENLLSWWVHGKGSKWLQNNGRLKNEQT